MKETKELINLRKHDISIRDTIVARAASGAMFKFTIEGQKNYLLFYLLFYDNNFY